MTEAEKQELALEILQSAEVMHEFDDCLWVSVDKEMYLQLNGSTTERRNTMTTANTTPSNIHAMPRPVRIVDKYSYNELHEAAHSMQRTGGGFASRLADAYFYADSTNKAIMLDAFGDLFEKFISEEVRLDAEQEQGDLFPALR